MDDGGRAGVTEEGISQLVYQYAKTRDMLRGAMSQAAHAPAASGAEQAKNIPTPPSMPALPIAALRSNPALPAQKAIGKIALSKAPAPEEEESWEDLMIEEDAPARDSKPPPR